MIKTKISIMYLFNVGISIFLMFGFKFLPPIGGLEEMGMAVVGIFFGMLYG